MQVTIMKTHNSQLVNSAILWSLFFLFVGSGTLVWWLSVPDFHQCTVYHHYVHTTCRGILNNEGVAVSTRYMYKQTFFAEAFIDGKYQLTLIQDHSKNLIPHYSLYSHSVFGCKYDPLVKTKKYHYGSLMNCEEYSYSFTSVLVYMMAIKGLVLIYASICLKQSYDTEQIDPDSESFSIKSDNSSMADDI